MRCEVIAVGTELLLGQIVDTNSSWMGEQLALAGIDSHYQTKVGDNLERIVDSLRIALDRSDAVILCGGLGPTPDDITRDAIAHVMGVRLVRNPDMEARIRRLFSSRGREMPVSNLRQADLPEGADFIPQMPGTAPGLVCPVGEKIVYAVPGVPYEMREMLLGTVIPDLQRRAGVSAVIKSRTLRTWGQTEAGLAEQLGGRMAELDETGNPTIAFLASGIEGLKVRITAKAPDQAAVDAILADEEARLTEILGDLIFGSDDDTMESVIIQLLRDQGLTLGVAESLTGGLVGARLTAVPGASDVFRGAVVSYASDVKFDLLGVPQGPVISEEAAQSMALGACRLLGANVGLGITGVAGPTEQEGQPVGTVLVAVAIDDETETHRVRLPGDRERLRQYAVISLLNLLRLRLLGRVGS
jgi:nicotinamide-nucleotide amidase